MVAALPADVFAGLESSPDTADTVDTSDSDGPDGTDSADISVMDADSDADPVADEPVADEPADDEPASDSDEDAEPVAAKTDDEALPDGVTRGKDRKGKPGLFLTEQRYETFHGNHKLAQEAAKLIGEPLTLEGVRIRNEALLGSERLWTNLTSGDPDAQGDVIDTILKEMREAQDVGATAVDPSVPFADTFYEKLRDGAPDAYAQIRLKAARELIQEMYELAAETGNDSLKMSMRHLAAGVVKAGSKPANMTPEQFVKYVKAKADAASLPFYDDDQVPALVKPPVSAEQQRIAELEAQLDRVKAPVADPAAQFGTWRDGNIKEVNAAVFDGAIKPALASVEGSWKDFPDDYKRLVVSPLHSEVARIVKADTGLKLRIDELQASARRAVSEQVRANIGEQIKQLYVSRAKLAAEEVKGPIIEFAGKSLKGRSDANHERRNGAQTRTAPKGQSAPVRKSALPDMPQFKNNEFDPKIAAQQAARLLASLNA